MAVATPVEHDDIVAQAAANQITPCQGCGQARDLFKGCINSHCLISNVKLSAEEIAGIDVWDVIAEARARIADRNLHVHHAVCDLAFPAFDEPGIETAAVGPRAGGGIQFFFSTDFLCKLLLHPEGRDVGLDDIAAVMSHEAQHIVSNHVKAMQKMTHKQLYNIAADIFVNTWLIHDAKLPFSDRLKKILFHAATIGMDPQQLLWYATAEDIYEMLLKDQKKSNELLRRLGDQLMKGDLQPGEAQSSTAGGTLDDHKPLGEIGQDAVDQIMKEVREKGACDRSKQAGTMPGEVERAYEELDQDFDWEGNVRRMQSSIVFRKTTYMRPHRLQPFMSPRSRIMPGVKIRYERHFGLYLDVSGSVGDIDLGRMVTVMRQHPPDSILHVYSFDGAVNEWVDWENFTSRPPGGGGTSFHAVVKHAEDPIRDYKADGYIVLTDGFCGEPKVKEPRKWLWITVGETLSEKCGHWTIMPPVGGQRRRERR